ncbi:MAG: hypothetical protein ACRDUA_01445 [Micromonosporaceae bacterium]
MQKRRTVRRTTKRQRSSLRTKVTLTLLAFSTVLGTGLVVAPVAFVA